MKALVTGGAGFIASHITDALIDAGHQVTVVDNLASGKRENVNPKASFCAVDVASPELERVFAEGRFDVVDHHAAQSSVSVSVKDPLLDARANIMGIVNLLQQCARWKVRKVIFASSGGTVYGMTDVLPAHEGLPFAAVSPYGVGKVTGELYLRVFAAQYGLAFTALRYGNVYGPRQDPFGEAGVIAIFAEKMMSGGKPIINGDGEYLRDYVFVEDVVRANLLALEKGDNEGVNIGTGEGTGTNAVFEHLKKLTGYTAEAEHGPPRAGDLRANYLDNRKAESMLGWSPRTRLAEGLSRTVDWFRSRKERP